MKTFTFDNIHVDQPSCSMCEHHAFHGGDALPNDFGFLRWIARLGFLVLVSWVLAIPQAQAQTVVPEFSSGNGSSISYIQVGAPDALQIASDDPFTVEGWILFNSLNSRDGLYVKNADRSNPYTYILGFINGHMGAYDGSGWTGLFDTSRVIGQWYHVAFAFDGTHMVFYLDGNELGSAAFSFTNDEAHTISIGGWIERLTPSGDIDGMKSDVRVWDHARTQSQIQDMMGRRLFGSEPGLLAYWPLNEGEGSTVADLTANGNDGTLVTLGSTVTWTTTDSLSFVGFTVMNPVTGSTRFVGTNKVDVADFPEYEGYDWYQITEDGAPPIDDPSEWESTSAPPASLSFDWPAAETNLQWTAWFTNSTPPVALISNSTSIIYTDVSPDVNVHATVDAGELVEGVSEIQIEIEDVDNGSTAGVVNGTNLTVYSMAIFCDEDSTPGESYVTLTTAGDYDVVLTMVNEAGLASSATSVVTVTSTPPVVYYVSTDGVNPDGQSWETAFTNIQDALNLATTDYDMIMITNGVYTGGSNEVMLVTNVNFLTISGLGDGQTIIDGEGLRRGITMTAAATNVTIEGLTVTRGVVTVGGPAGNLHSYGAGLFMDAGTVRNCIFVGNTNNRPRSVYGGAVYMTGGLLQDSLITGNRASGTHHGRAWGGGVYIEGGIVDRCMITSNSVNSANSSDGERGGGVYVHAGTLQNSLVYGNTTDGELWILGRANVGSRAVRGAGVYVGHADGRVLNCTISRNTTIDDLGAGLWMAAGIASNTIVYANSLTSRPSDLFRRDFNVHLAGSAAIRYSCMTPLMDGEGNIDADPLFADPENGDFRLLPGSPAINAGSALGDITVDINEELRPRDGNGSGTPAHDMGAIESPAYNAGPLRAGFTLPVNRAFDSLDAELTAHVAGADTNSLTYWWDFLDDGNETDGGADKAAVTNTYSYGAHSVRLTVSNATETVTSVRTSLIHVAPPVIYVDANAADATAPFNTPATATDDLQAALDWAIEIDDVVSEIRVDDGEYTLTEQLHIVKPLTLLSENGAEFTTLRQTGGNQRVMYIGQFAAGTLIDGFTFTGGSVHPGGGVCMLVDATVRNSTITGNASASRWVDGAGVYMLAGRLENCEVTANSGAYGSHNGELYGAGIHMRGGIVDRCIVAGNTNSTTSTSIIRGAGVFMNGSSTLQNTLVYGNVIDGANDDTKNRAGGVYMESADCRMLNCTVADNAIGLDGRGGGLYLLNGYVTNSIVYYNTIAASHESDNVYVSPTTTGFDYSCTTPAVAGTGNLTDNPQFNNRDGSDYTLNSLSPMIDEGTDLTAAGVTNDLAGIARPQGDFHDMGAYEAPPAGDDLTVAFAAESTEVIEMQDVVFTATLGGANTDNVYFRWDFNNDGTIDLEGYDLTVVTNDVYAPGYYTVRVTVSNALDEVAESISSAGYIRIAPPIVYVATNGWHTVPFDTSLKAATNLQDAINEALITATATSMVLVAPGVYEVTTPVLLNKGITVRSSDGPQTTIFRKSDSVSESRVFEITDANAVLDGFTVRDGRGPTLNYNGSGIFLDSGLVQNCFIIANQAPSRQSWGGGLRINSGGILRNSLVAGNWVQGQDNGGAGGGGIYLVGGRVENCTVVGNRADANAGPAAYGGGIHRASGTITNTIVFFNYAESGYSDLYGGAAGVGFSASPDLLHDPAGTGNITNAPSFFDAGSDFGLDHVFGDYQLERDSAGVNVGTNQTWMVNASDLAGNPRILQSIVDMGAYEAVPPRGTVFLMR